VVDLGAAPGGWSLIAAQRVAAPQSGRIVSIDLLPGSFAECVRVSVLVLLTKRCSGP
jgi:23S rRNA U2552 (ribose-2'-O)-methylase RlmE/FtsJ